MHRFFIGPLVLMFLLAILLSAATAFAGLAVSPGTPAHTHTDANTGGGTLAVSGTVSSTKACAAGYTRMTPNYCADTPPQPATVGQGRDTCTAVSMPAGDAKGVTFYFSVAAKSANAVALRDANLTFYSDSGCTTVITATGISAREETAVVAGTTMAIKVGRIDVPGTAIWSRFSDDAGNQGTADMSVVGYFD